MDDCFYIGSCRYLTLFDKKFGAFLYSTREILNFLTATYHKNMQMNSLAWYGINMRRHIHDNVLKYIHNKCESGCTTLVMEISTFKVLYKNKICMIHGKVVVCGRHDTPINVDQFHAEVRRKLASVVTLTPDEVVADLIKIEQLAKLCGYAKCFIIPHVNLPSRKNNGELIPQRNLLCKTLADAAATSAFYTYVDIAAGLQDKYPVIENVMEDAQHWNAGADHEHILAAVKDILVNKINQQS